MAQSTITSLARGFVGAGVPGRVKAVNGKEIEESKPLAQEQEEDGKGNGGESKVEEKTEELAVTKEVVA